MNDLSGYYSRHGTFEESFRAGGYITTCSPTVVTMWVINDHCDAETHAALVAGGQSVEISRNSAPHTIVLVGDNGVSRKRHAVFHVNENDELVLTNHSVVTSVGSRRAPKVAKGHSVILKDCDEVFFGKSSKELVIRRLQLVFCVSRMNSTARRQLKELADKVGARLVSAWSTEVTHLISFGGAVTSKVLCALAAQRPVVSIKWVEQLYENSRSQPLSPTPDPSAFPPDGDTDGVSWNEKNNVRASREYLRGKTFVFFSGSQMDQFVLPIQTVGASTLLVKDLSAPELDAVSDFCLVSPPPAEIENFVDHDVPMIDDSLIGTAFLDPESGKRLLKFSAEFRIGSRKRSSAQVKLSIQPETKRPKKDQAQRVSNDVSVANLTLRTTKEDASDQMADADYKCSSDKILEIGDDGLVIFMKLVRNSVRSGKVREDGRKNFKRFNRKSKPNTRIECVNVEVITHERDSIEENVLMDFGTRIDEEEEQDRQMDELFASVGNTPSKLRSRARRPR